VEGDRPTQDLGSVEERGERWMKLAMVRCVRAGVYGAEYLLAMAGEVAA